MLDSFINEYRRRKPDGLGTPDLCPFFKDFTGLYTTLVKNFCNVDCNVYCLPVKYVRTPIVRQLVKILLPQEKRINGSHLGA